MIGVEADQVTAGATLALAVLAIVAAVIAWKHRAVVVVDVYFRLVDRIEKPDVAEAQKRVRTALAQGSRPTTTDLKTVLNALEMIAMATRRGMVQVDVVWRAQGDRIIFYWFGCLEMIRDTRGNDKTIWEDLEWLVGQLQAHNKKRGVRWADGAPSPAEIRQYFAAELADDKCRPRQDAGTH